MTPATFPNSFLRINPQDQHRDVDVGYSALFEVPDELFKVADTTTHFIRQGLDRNNFYSRVDVLEISENRHLGRHVIDHERILAELNLHAEFAFDEIHFPKRAGAQLFGLIIWCVEACRIFTGNPDGLPTVGMELLLELLV